MYQSGTDWNSIVFKPAGFLGAKGELNLWKDSPLNKGGSVRTELIKRLQPEL